MSKIIALILSLFTSIFPPQTTDFTINNQIFTLEIAKTTVQKTLGLMYRQSLCQNCGMLFKFDAESIYPFWMKNTSIPLDIIWLDRTGRVVDIKKGQPQNTTPLTNSLPAKYVLETNLNATNLKIGDVLFINQNL
jgi:uncharacterized membrane protein (UPF0127 family)